MNRRISIGTAVTFAILLVTLTFVVTMVYSIRSFSNKVNTLNEREAMYKKYSELDRIVRQNYFGAIDETALMDAVSAGYLGGIGDNYSRYFSASQYADIMQKNSGKTVSIGIEASVTPDGYILVTDVYPDSSAESAGFLKGDLIVNVDGANVTADNAAGLIASFTGDAGTKVTLTRRSNGEDTALELTRRSVEIPVVTSKMLAGDGIAIVTIKEFGDTAPAQFVKTVDQLIAQGVKGFIFDVRNNPGGTIPSVCKILDELLPAGPIATATTKDGVTSVLGVSDDNEINLPMAVMVNQKTASSAELFAQALSDYQKAKIVGVSTLGKGVMQEIFKLSDGSAVELTVAKFFSPSGINFTETPVKPDYEVKTTLDQDIAGALDIINDIQLQKAIEVERALVLSSIDSASQQDSQAASQETAAQ